MIESTLRKGYFRSRNFENCPGSLAPPSRNQQDFELCHGHSFRPDPRLKFITKFRVLLKPRFNSCLIRHDNASQIVNTRLEGVSGIYARGRLTSSLPRLSLITNSRRCIVHCRNKRWGISIQCKMSRDRFFAIDFFSNVLNQADLLRLVPLDCFYFKRKRLQEVDRATFALSGNPPLVSLLPDVMRSQWPSPTWIWIPQTVGCIFGGRQHQFQFRKFSQFVRLLYQDELLLSFLSTYTQMLYQYIQICNRNVSRGTKLICSLIFSFFANANRRNIPPSAISTLNLIIIDTSLFNN